MKTIRKISDAIYYLGVSDRRLALFENLFPLDNGVSYNSYFIDDENVRFNFSELKMHISY